jgi:hypothetical protein
MGRRVTSGVVGGSGLGTINVVASTITTTTTNGDLTFEPNGTGRVLFTRDAQLQAQNDLRFADSDSSNWVALQAPATIATNYTLTLPAAVSGTNGFALTSDTSGNLSWSAAGAALTDNNSDSNTNYLAFTTQTSGFLTAARVATTTRPLTYQPSTGTLDLTGPVKYLRIENPQTGNYTLALTDRNIVVTMNNTSSATVTVPADGTTNFPIGSVVYISRINTGAVTLAAAGGVTLSKTGTFGPNEEIFIRKRAANTWLVVERPYNLSGTGGTVGTVGFSTTHSYTSTGSSTFTVVS